MSINSDVRRYAYTMLQKAAVGDRLPTPIDDIVACAKLMVSQNVSLNQKSKDVALQFPLLLRQAIKKVVGLVDLREDIIYLDQQVLPQKRNFVTLHEVGHKVLPWQRETYLYIDDDASLDPDVYEQFEQEANQFAADVLFQIDRFDEDARDLPFAITSPVALAQRYGASAHASIRRYVEWSEHACAVCIIGQHHIRQGRESIPQVRRCVQSLPFTQRFGEIDWNSNMRKNTSLLASTLYPHRYPQGDLVIDSNNNNHISCRFEVFTNSYDTFVLIYPCSEKSRSI